VGGLVLIQRDGTKALFLGATSFLSSGLFGGLGRSSRGCRIIVVHHEGQDRRNSTPGDVCSSKHVQDVQPRTAHVDDDGGWRETYAYARTTG
jgi:hypothetical protein